MKKQNAYREGILAFRKGNLTNPYAADTTRNRDWAFGFDRAYFENLERVKNGETKKAGNTA